MTDKNSKLTQPIKFTGERKVFFTSKKTIPPPGESTTTLINPPVLVPIPQEKPKEKVVEKREKFSDEVTIVFDPKKYKIVNPTARFEYRRCKIEFKLADIFHEDGEIMALFIDQFYKTNSDIRKLKELCEYDIVECLNEQKLKTGKVVPLTSQSFDKFEGIFLVYIDEQPNRITLSQCLRAFLNQVQQNKVEQICIELFKKWSDSEELVNTYIDEIIQFLSRAKQVPKKISIITQSSEHYDELSRSYSDIITKLALAGSVCIHREKLY